MKIVFLGTPDYVVCVPEALKKAGHEIVAVVTQPPRPVGRKQVLTLSPVAMWAENNSVSILDEKPEEMIQDLQFLNADVGVLEAYGEILPAEIISLFPHGIVNVHPSLLPKYRGSSPLQTALLHGDTTTGITVIKLDNQMDHGPILAQQEEEILPQDTFESLRQRLFEKSARVLTEILPLYVEGKITPIPQDEGNASNTWTTQETKQKAFFDLTSPPSPEELNRMIRAFYPWPVAWSKWQDKIIKFYPNKTVQLEGKNPVPIKTFMQGYPEAKEWLIKLFPNL